MAPFYEEESLEIRRRDNWKCKFCGKSSFDKEMYLMEAMHEDHERNERYHDIENGVTGCRICHLLHHMDLNDKKSVEGISNRIWNSGLRHISQYRDNFDLLIEERIMLSELLSASGWGGRINIKDEVSNYDEMRGYIDRNRRKRK